METNILSHLYGIYSILQARINLINRSIGHNLTQGEENEDAIRSLLADFLPSAYGIGSGIIIGTDGKESKHVDIVIYDKERANYTLSSNSRIFLADHVIAAIEIKTTYGTGKDSSLEQALSNIASVKKLKVAPREWKEVIFDPLTRQYQLIDYKPTPPLGIVFFFRAPETQSALNIDRFVKTLKQAIDKISVELQPDLLFSLDHAAFFRYKEIGVRKAANQEYDLRLVQFPGKRKGITISDLGNNTKAFIDFADTKFSEGEMDTIPLTNSKSTSSLRLIVDDTFNLDPIVYRTARIRGKFYLLDKFRAFLNFVWLVERMVSLKRPNKAWLPVDYFGDDFFGAANYFKNFK